MGIKISQLPGLTLSQIVDDSTLPIVDKTTSGTKKVTVGNIKTYVTSGLSSLAFSGSYADIQNLPATFPVATASDTTLGGIKVGAYLSISAGGILSATPGFTTFNIGNVQLTSTNPTLNVIGGSNVTIDADPGTNTITINSTGGGSGGSGSGTVGNGTTGTLSVYFTKNNVTGTNLTTDGDSLNVPLIVSAGGLVASQLTITSIVTTIGDLTLNPASNISVAGKRITNVSTPVGANDAANKAYVDNISSRAFGKVGVAGQGTVSATSGTDTINFAAGNNVSITTNPATKTVTVAVNNTLTFNLLPATTASIGGIIVGGGLSIDGNGILSATASALTTATTSTIGGVKIGSGINISGDGTISSSATFVLNTATGSTLGGIKIGNGLVIDQNGTVSVPSQILSTATRFVVGGVKIGNSISAAVDGTIDVNASAIAPATTSTLGVVKPGYGLSVGTDGSLNLGVDGNFTITGNLSVNGVISATNIFTTGTAVTIISSANDLQLRAVGQVITNTTLYVNTTTVATTTATGALQVVGGIGVGKNLWVGEASTINGLLIGSGGSAQPNNVAIGTGALGANNGAQYLTAVGYNALLNANASENSAYGYNAAPSLTSGQKNTFVGISAGTGMTSGTFNSAFGHQAYLGTGNSSYNTVLGSYINFTSAQVETFNTLVGYNILNGTTKPGSYNTAIGANTLNATTGSYNTVIGYGAGSGLTTATGQVIIGGYSGAGIATLTNYVSISDGAGNLRAQWDGKGILTQVATATIFSTANATTSSASGALQVAGGASIVSDLWVGNNIYSLGSKVVTEATLGSPITSLTAGTDTQVVTVGLNAVKVFSNATLNSIASRGGSIQYPIDILDSTNSASSQTGALKVTGGIATRNNLSAGGTVTADQGLYDGTNRVVTSVQVIAGTGLSGGGYVTGNTSPVGSVTLNNAGVTSISAGTGVSVSAGTGNVTISAAQTLNQVTNNGGTSNQPISINSPTSVSTSTSTGGLIVIGGMGLTGDLNMVGNLTINGATISTSTVFNGGTITGSLTVNNATAATSSAGAIRVTGGLSVGSNAYIGSNTAASSTVTGALQVLGGVGVGGALYATSLSGLGSGFANMVVLTSGTAASWTVPTGVLRWKVTLVGGGGSGGGSAASAGAVGNGGGSGGVVVGYYNYVAGQTAMTYWVGTGGGAAAAGSAGNAGTASTSTYNAVSYTAGFGSGGATSATVNGGGTAGTATGGTLNLAGNKGRSGGTAAATNPVSGFGGDSPLNFGLGGDFDGTAAGANGVAAQGYGAGGGGGKSGSAATARSGGAGGAGLIIIEY